MRKLILKIKTELFLLKLKFFKVIDKNQLHKQIRCALDLENTVIPDINYIDYIKELFNA